MKKTLVTIAILALVGGCDSDFINDPPVAITLRAGAMSQYVLQVNNLTTKEGLEVYVYAASSSDSTRSGNIVIPANSAKEFGVIEMGWRFKEGDHGFVAIKRHTKKLFFEILENGQYRTWFGLNDIPEIDVAAELRAKKEAEHRAQLKSMCELNGKRGIELFHAMNIADVERQAAGLPSVWPKAQGDLSERVKDAATMLKGKIVAKFRQDGQEVLDNKDISNLKFGNSTDYFNVLLDIQRKGKDNWAPYIMLSNGIDTVSISTAENQAAIAVANNRWSVLADVDDELSDCIPVLVSANFPCERLRSAWDGKECASEVVSLLPIGDMKDEAFVVVFKSGTAKVISANCATLGNIYPRAFNTSTNGYNKALQYLTPSGIKNAAGL